MSNLYRYGYGTNFYYVVAESYADAEETIIENEYRIPESIEDLGSVKISSLARETDDE
jgi:hypothetical protein